PLKKLIDDRCRFEVIVHRIDSERAEAVDPGQTDITVRLVASSEASKLEVTLFKMPNTELEKVLLGGDYLSHIANPIAGAPTLPLYSKPEPERTDACQRMDELRLSPQKIDWDEDRRLVARLIDVKTTLFAFRRRQIKVFDWNDVPGEGAEHLRAF